MSVPLRVVQPMTITDAMLISTDVPENDYAAWSAGTTYALGNRIIRASVHKVFESLANGNTGNAPETSPGQWAEVSPTNRWKLFDTSTTTATAQSTAMTYTLRPVGSFNAVSALSLTGVNSIRFRVTHPTLGTLYDRTFETASKPAQPGWWEWFFGTRTAPSTVVLTDLPGIVGTDLIADFAGTTDMAVGVLAVGATRDIGLGVLQGARLGIVDYSRKETNDFGDTVLVQRAFAKRVEWQVPIEADQVDATFDYLAGLRAVPCIWIGSTKYGSLTLLGFYKDMNVSITYATMSECSLQIEGLT